jgi:hypothetical protein
MMRSFVKRCLLPVLAALAFLSPVPSQAFIQGLYTSAPPTLSVPVLPAVANGPDLPAFGPVSEDEFGFRKSCRNDPDHTNAPRRRPLQTGGTPARCGRFDAQTTAR